MTKRKFYKTVISIEVLSEVPIPDSTDLEHIVHECIVGDWSMRPLKHKETEINGRQAANGLIKQGSSTDFFGLDEKGNDVADEGGYGN